MQIHTPSPMPLDDGDFPVQLNTVNRHPFAIIDLDELGTRIYVENVKDADRLIRAAVAAKDLLIEATGAVVRVAACKPETSRS
jgi:hypothetical protein